LSLEVPVTLSVQSLAPKVKPPLRPRYTPVQLTADGKLTGAAFAINRREVSAANTGVTEGNAPRTPRYAANGMPGVKVRGSVRSRKGNEVMSKNVPETA